MLPATINPGMEFTHPKALYKIVIKEVLPFEIVKYRAVSDNKTIEYSFDYIEFYKTLRDEGWVYNYKPLDQSVKQLDIQLCSHRNIREDRYFSAMVYKTCKDCGQALN